MLAKILGIALLVLAAFLALKIAFGIFKVLLPIVAVVALFYYGWRLLGR